MQQPDGSHACASCWSRGRGGSPLMLILAQMILLQRLLPGIPGLMSAVQLRLLHPCLEGPVSSHQGCLPAV